MSDKPSPTALALGLRAYGLSEQLWGRQHTKINASELIEDIARHVDEAISAEREACAMIADEWGKRKDQTTDTAFVPGACHGERYAADGIYNAIRARGKT